VALVAADLPMLVEVAEVEDPVVEPSQSSTSEPIRIMVLSRRVVELAGLVAQPVIQDLLLVVTDQVVTLAQFTSNKSLYKGGNDVKLIYIYSMHNEVERAALNRLRDELGMYIVGEYDYLDVKDLIPIRTTPAFLILRDDLQGDELLDGDVQLKITAEAMKAMGEEDLKIHQKETNRLDNFISGEKMKAVNVFKTEIKADLSPTAISALPEIVKTKLGLE